ncbi:C69 family dipeptidase [Levilactobacillus huananensis]|uniref:C69 family dipeptidase n=1 Tax=Levilactobacillus huananensis TaxID=2486019 RepID=UPI000F76C88A|nr:C69 family dipeptidase [Levilactobacillus huananensis]
MSRMLHQACTSFLAGKNATIDGNPVIARNEDNGVAIWPKRVVVHVADEPRNLSFISKGNQFRTTLPEKAYHYTAVPDTDPSAGFYEESGINAKNVAMSATESAYANSRVLGVDPLVADGIAEDAMLTVVLPYIDSAKAGVQRLGHLVETNGAAESNGILFGDTNEVWYMEIVSGHHWVAQRIPDDAYAVVANQLAIQDIDFDRPQEFMTSTNIRQFVQGHHLNPDGNRFNSRHIFGTATATDSHYNTPRVWYGHKLFTPSAFENPTDQELPFIQHAEKKISLPEIANFLGSHYQETPYDPLGTGTDTERHQFRAVGLSRTQNSHILQLRRDVVPMLAGIVWQCFGNPAFNPYVPFYAQGDQLAADYAVDNSDYQGENPYWASKLLDVLSEDHYHKNRQLIDSFLGSTQALGYQRLHAGDALPTPNPASLGSLNVETASVYATAIQTQAGKLVQANAALSDLSFTMDANL